MPVVNRQRAFFCLLERPPFSFFLSPLTFYLFLTILLLLPAYSVMEKGFIPENIKLFSIFFDNVKQE